MLWRVLLLAALGGALVDEHDEDSVVINGECREKKVKRSP
jgi:hypothetical protein